MSGAYPTNAAVERTEPVRVKFATALIAVSAIAALAVGRPVLVPLSLAVLIAFALAPIAAVLRKVADDLDA